MVFVATRRPRRTVSPLGGALALGVVLVISAAWAAGPSRVLAATTMFAACDGVNLRTNASTSASSVTQVSTGTQVNVTATVEGSAWNATCAGVAVAGTAWHQIDTVNGVSVATVFGVPFVYGATGLFNAGTPPPSGFPTPTPSSSPVPTPTPDPTTTEGIDVSHWQGVIDWVTVAASGKRFVYMKASEGTALVDTTYPANRAQAKAVGLYVGAYHYARPSATPGDAVAEADHFLATAQIAQGELLPVLDLEETGGLSIAALQTWVQEFVGRVYERTGAHGVIYVAPNFWKNNMGDTNWFALNGYATLWVAHWTGSGPSIPGGNWGGHGWTFWQYTSSGSVPGIVGRVDLNRYHGTDFTPVLLQSTPYIPPEPIGSPISVTTSAPIPAGAQSPVVAWGEEIALGVQFSGGPNRPVQLEGSRDGLTWAPIATLTTDGAGGAGSVYRPVTNLFYRAVFAGAPELAAANSNQVRTVVRQTAVLRPTNGGSVRAIRRNSSITFTTTVRPARPELEPATVSFYFYRQVSGAWRLVTTRDVVIDASGLARTTFKFTSTGQWYIRSQANPTPYNANSLMTPVERYTVR